MKFLNSIEATLKSYSESLIDLGNLSSLDVNKGNTFTKNLTTTLNLSLVSSKSGKADSITLYLKTGTTSYTVTYPNTIKWQSNKPPEMVENKMYILTFSTIDGGTTWFGNWGEY